MSTVYDTEFDWLAADSLAAVFDGSGRAEGLRAARQLEQLHAEGGVRLDWARTAKLVGSHLWARKEHDGRLEWSR